MSYWEVSAEPGLRAVMRRVAATPTPRGWLLTQLQFDAMAAIINEALELGTNLALVRAWDRAYAVCDRELRRHEVEPELAPRLVLFVEPE